MATSTVSRRLSDVQAIITKGNREFELPDVNAFRGLKVPHEGADAKKVLPFTMDELRAIASACVEKDDDIRHIIAMQMDTGSRIGEIVGLHTRDLFLDAPIPYVWFRANAEAGRTLKTPNSERSVPLVGMALWAAKRARAGEGWLFPRYASDGDIRGTQASAAVNKWLTQFTSVRKGSHSFRHAMRDRLLAADVRQEIAEAIMGHGAKSISKGYGAGYTVDFLGEHLSRVAINQGALPS